MYEFVKRQLLQLLRVPHDPAAPAGSPGSLKIFRASPRLYQWNLVRWGVTQFSIALPLLLLMIGLFAGSAKMPVWLQPLTRVGIGTVGLAFLVQLLMTFWMQKLDYEMRWYVVTDRSLRIRAGVWSVREVTMTFANIQKVEVSQGPIQKILGIATVVVSSAGGGSASGPHGQTGSPGQHSARFEGVDNAREIRDTILDRLRRYRDAGLGDTPVTLAAQEKETDTMAAAQAVLAAARELRVAIASIPPASK